MDKTVTWVAQVANVGIVLYSVYRKTTAILT